MNKLKISLALIALIIPLLLCAKKRNIEFIKHGNHRIPVESFIPVKAFFDDCNKELTIEFAQDWEAVTIEIKSKEGYVVYRNLYIPHSNSSLSTSLENIPCRILYSNTNCLNTSCMCDNFNDVRAISGSFLFIIDNNIR